MSDRVRPHSESVEEALVGACISFPEIISGVLEIVPHPHIFYTEKYSKIWETIKHLKEHNAVDSVSITDELISRGCMDIVGQATISMAIGEVVSPSNALYHAKLIRDDYDRRCLISSLEQAHEKAYDRTVPISAIVEPLRSQEFIRISSGCEHVSDSVGPVIDEIEQAWQGKTKIGIPSSIETVDYACGGWQPGELYLIAARPSVGKTALALYTALGAGLPVAFFSIEMTKRMLIHRLLSAYTKIPSHFFRNGKITPDEYEKIQNAENLIKKLPLYIEDTMKDIGKIRDETMKLIDKHDIRMAVVDYIQIANPTSIQGNRDRDIANISDNLKSLAKEADIPILALSQLSRESERSNREPELHDLRDSGTLEQDADVVIFLHRTNTLSKRVVLKIGKNRNGPVGRDSYTFDGLSGTFTKREEEEEA